MLKPFIPSRSFILNNLVYFQIAEAIVVASCVGITVWAVFFRSCGC